jgi:hypothetical protein
MNDCKLTFAAGRTSLQSWLRTIFAFIGFLAVSVFASTAYGIDIDVTTSNDQSVPSATIATTAFSTQSPSELLLAFVSADSVGGTNTTVTGVTGGGLTWVLVRRTNAQRGTAEIWRAFATVPLANVTVTASLSQTVSSSLTVMSFTGVDSSGTNGSGAIGATGSGSAPAGAPTATLTTTRNNSWVMGVGVDWDNPISRVVGANQTLVHQFMPPAGDTYWVQRLNAPTPVAPTSVTLNDTAPTADRYNLTVVEVLPPVATSTYSLSGVLSPASVGSGATVNVAGAVSATTIADANGAYSFSGLVAGSYTITPIKNGVVFSPASQTVSISGANATGVSFSGQAQGTTPTCPCSIWPATARPTNVADSDTAAVELGVKLRSNTNGLITGIRFYKGTTNTGVHIGNLWTSTGTLLGSVTFTGETTSGWQQANFSTPIAVTANTTYVASYHTNVGHYAGDVSYFANTGLTNGPLTALANGVDGSNGVYRYGTTSAFPNQTWVSTNYWVDVVFTPAVGGDTVAPIVSGRTPASGATGVATNTGVTVTFSEAIDTTTLTASTFTLQSGGSSVPATLTYNAASRTATLTPASPLIPGTLYTATIKGGTTDPRVKDTAGNALATSTSWSFTTASAATYAISGTLTPSTLTSGATVTLGGAASVATVATATGTYTFPGLAAGTYVVTPTKPGVVFNPASQIVTISGTNPAAANFAAQADTTATVISGVTASSLTRSSATIQWTTSKPADSQVEYGTSAAYGSTTGLNASLVTSHSVRLTNLLANTLYHYRVRSKDSSGNQAVSQDFVFTTPPGTAGTLNGHTVLTDSSGKIISWVTPQQSAYSVIVARNVNFLINGIPTLNNGLKAYFTQSYLNPDLTPSGWPHNPAGTYAMFTESALRQYSYFGDSRMIDLAQQVLDYHLAHGMTGATGSWALVPYASADAGATTYSGASYGNTTGAGDGVGVIQPDKVGELGFAFLRMYEFSGNANYRNAAVQAADMLASHVRTGDASRSPWPFRVYAATNIAREEYCADVIGPIRLFDELIRLNIGNTASYGTARQTAWNWLMTYPMQNNVWANYFEDVPIQSNLRNVNQYNALETAYYLLEHPESDANWQSHVAGLIRWVETTFAVSQFGANAIKEQVAFAFVMGSHTSRYAGVNALLSQRTGDVAAKEKAFRAFNWASYMSADSGLTIDGPDVNHIWFTDGFGDFVRHFMRGLAAVPEWSPAGENHLLQSTGVIKSISYLPAEIDYQTFDSDATETLRLNFAPTLVTADGQQLQQVSDVSQPGWVFDATTGLLTVHHSGATSIRIVR